MKNSKRSIAFVLAGMMLGTLLTGPVASAAEQLTAQRSTQRFYVDGERVQMEAYTIGGSNYVKLRDIGRIIGFNVTWNAEINGAMIDTNLPYEDDAFTMAADTVVLPTDGSKFIPKAGDKILCDDGYIYEITDTLRWENNVFAPGPLPELLTPTCDWSRYPTLELPEPEVKHYNNQYGDDLFILNVYETRRMLYTIYNALGNEPNAWRDGKPLATVRLDIPVEYDAYTARFWPWRESEIVDLVHSRPNSRYYISAYDYFHDGIFQCSRYLICSL